MYQKIINIFAILGIIWSILAFVAVVSFSASEHWKDWKEIKEAHAKGMVINIDITDSFVKAGDQIKLKTTNGYLFDHSSKGRDELDVVIAGPTSWLIEK